MTIKHLDDVQWDTLTWPEHKPRASRRIRGTFAGPEIDSQSAKIKLELGRMVGSIGCKFKISRNRQRAFAGDPGVALWWRKEGKDNSLRVLACDKYETQAANLRAICLTIEAMRALERYGAYTAEQAAEGARIALPAPEDANTLDWKSLLGKMPDGVRGDDAIAIVNMRYRKQAAEAAGDDDRLRRLNLAVELARKELAS